MRSEPTQRLDPRAKQLWRIQGAISSAFLLLPALGVSFILRRVLDLSDYIALIPLALWLLLAVLAVLVTPGVRWRRWRYDIGDAEVDLQRGIFYVTRTLVPLARVQHVDTQQGPIERSLGLSSVVFYTAAGPNAIPALATSVAEQVRDHIAALTQVRDEL